MEAFAQAVQEVAETGTLSFSIRRELWLALGPWEERDERDQSPRTLTEPLNKRAQLALACARKVGKVWTAYDQEDKGPQELLKKANAYLKGKLEADKLYQAWKASDYMHRTQEERYSAAPMAAIAAERAAIVPYYDEFLLEPCYADADDTDLDPYDWDAAWCASLAWAGQDENASPGEQRVAELKFWAWYLEQTAKLLGMEGWRFPRKAVKAFAEMQELARPVPEEVSMESLSDFLGQGDYRFHYRLQNNFGDGAIFGGEDHGYDIYTMCRSPEGICPKCKAHVTKAEFWYTVNALEAMLPGTDVSVRVLHTLPMFRCPDHPDDTFTPQEDYVNPKAALRHFLEGPGRLPALLDQLESRKESVFEIGGGYIALNGNIAYRLEVTIPPWAKGIRWLSQDPKELEIDLRQFGPAVYFDYLTLEEYRAAYPEQTKILEDGSIQLTMKRHRARCFLNGQGGVERVVVSGAL